MVSMDVDTLWHQRTTTAEAWIGEGSSAPAGSMAREPDPNCFTRRDRLRLSAGPGRGLGEVLPRHVERRDLSAEYADGLNRHRNRPAPPPEPPTVLNDKLNPA